MYSFIFFLYMYCTFFSMSELRQKEVKDLSKNQEVCRGEKDVVVCICWSGNCVFKDSLE